jgi:hypothetical protein
LKDKYRSSVKLSAGSDIDITNENCTSKTVKDYSVSDDKLLFLKAIFELDVLNQEQALKSIFNANILPT